MIIAMIAFICHAPVRVVGVAACLGLIALSIQLFTWAVGAIVLAILVAAVL